MNRLLISIILALVVGVGCADNYQRFKSVEKKYPNAEIVQIPQTRAGEFWLVKQEDGTVRVVTTRSPFDNEIYSDDIIFKMKGATQ